MFSVFHVQIRIFSFAPILLMLDSILQNVPGTEIRTLYHALRMATSIDARLRAR